MRRIAVAVLGLGLTLGTIGCQGDATDSGGGATGGGATGGATTGGDAATTTEGAGATGTDAAGTGADAGATGETGTTNP